MARKTVSNRANQLRNLVRRHGTPVLAISRSALREQFERFRRELPRVTPFYAVKANPHVEVLKVLLAAGAGFDVASQAEMDAALAVGAKPPHINYANTIKRPEAIAAAAEAGVLLTTFDSEYELDKIAEHAPGSHVIVRIKVPNVGSIIELSLKFGVEPADAVAFLIKAHQLGLKPVGVSFHVGSQCTHIGNYIDALEMTSIIVRDARLKQIPVDVVDIGGGFPIPGLDGDGDPFDRLAPVIAAELDRLFEPNVRIIAEPGRFLVGPAATLVTRVIGKAIRENKHWYYLDDGLYGTLNGIIFDHAHYRFRTLKRGKTRLSTLAGPTCDSLDIIARGQELPELDIGDVVYVEDIGAYSNASATDFNGIPRAKTVMVP